MTAYYNENEPFAAAWLRELIKAGAIAPGDVDERSIEDVRPGDLTGYTQCHFFAGIGGWSYALRLAGWPDDAPVWTGSCPCQPFSAAGRRDGFNDERHLWPAFAWLIGQCQPATIFGEQVASKATGPWFDLVQTDLEALGYAFGCVPFPSAGVGAPHIRDRAYWVADLQSERRTNGATEPRGGRPVFSEAKPEFGVRNSLPVSGVANSDGERRREARGCCISTGEAERAQRDSGDSGMGNADCARPLSGAFSGVHSSEEGAGARHGELERSGTANRAAPTNGFWRDVDWLFCRDGKWRPVEPGTFPLADGVSARVGRLRGYGNAINPEQAQAFIESFMELN